MLLHEAITDPRSGRAAGRREPDRQGGPAPARRHAARAWLQRESDPAVLGTIAETVSQNLWEPANDRRLVELRLWAQRHMRDPERKRRPGAAQNGAGWEGPAPTVLVTGAGGAAGVAVIQALRERGITTVGVDADELATGMRLADRSGTIPRSDDPAFIEGLLGPRTAAGRTRSSRPWRRRWSRSTRRRTRSARRGLRHGCRRPQTIQNCVDKWRFAQAVKDAGVPVPATALGLTPAIPGPWIVKPRFGRGSRDVHRADQMSKLIFAQSHVPDPIVQTRLHGMEFTVDALVDRDGVAGCRGAPLAARDEGRHLEQGAHVQGRRAGAGGGGSAALAGAHGPGERAGVRHLG